MWLLKDGSTPFAGLLLLSITVNVLSFAHAQEKNKDACTTCWGDWHSHDNKSPAVSSPTPSEVIETIYVSHTTTVSGSYVAQSQSTTTSTRDTEETTTSQTAYVTSATLSQTSAEISSFSSFQSSSSQIASTSTSSMTDLVSSAAGSISTSQSRIETNPSSDLAASSPSSRSASTLTTQQSSVQPSSSGTVSPTGHSTPISQAGSSTHDATAQLSSSSTSASAGRPSNSITDSESSAATQTLMTSSSIPVSNSQSESQLSLTSQTFIQTRPTTVTESQTTFTSVVSKTIIAISQAPSPGTSVSGPSIGQPTAMTGPSPTSASPTSTTSSSLIVVPGMNPAPPQSLPTVAPSASCLSNYSLPWCTSIPGVTSPICLCPECYGNSEYCSAVKPTGTTECPDLWLCSLGVDPEGHVTHPLPPGYDFTRSTPTSGSNVTLPWWRVYSTLTATDRPQTTDAPFNASLEYKTVTQSDGTRVIYPHREWKCIAGPLCFPIGFDFHLFDLLCFFHIPPQCGAGFWNIWPKPRFPFPPPTGPVGLEYELTPTTIPPDGKNDPQSSATTTKSCTQISTFSTCSTICSTVTVSSSASETCAATCKTTSGCFGTDLGSITTTGDACSISPYWNDPAIASSVSSMLAQFPFTVDDIMPFTDTGSVTNSSTSSRDSTTSNSSSSSGFMSSPSSVSSISFTSSRSSVTSTSSVPSGVTSSSSLMSSMSSTSKSFSSSTTDTQSIDFTWSHPPTSTTSVPSSTATIDWAARSQACHDYNYNIEERVEYGRFPHSLHAHVLCADAAEDENAAYFWWHDAVIKDVCESMRSRNVSMKWDPDTWTSEQQIQDVSSGTSECYRYLGPSGNYYNEDASYDILVQIALDAVACDFDLDAIWGNQCKDAQCMEFSFGSYSMDDCQTNFDKIHKECKTKDRNGRSYTVGGTFFNDCMRWSIVAGGKKVKNLPLSTDDHPVGLGTGPQAQDLGRVGF